MDLEGLVNMNLGRPPGILASLDEAAIGSLVSPQTILFVAIGCLTSRLPVNICWTECPPVRHLHITQRHAVSWVTFTSPWKLWSELVVQHEPWKTWHHYNRRMRVSSSGVCTRLVCTETVQTFIWIMQTEVKSEPRLAKLPWDVCRGQPY